MNFYIKAAWETRLLFLAIILSSLLPVKAISQEIEQMERLLRVEIPARSDDETYRLVPMGEKGVLLFYKSLETAEQDKIKWYFTFYDADLQSVWSKSIPVAGSLDFRRYSVDKDTVGLIFTTSEKARNARPSIEIIRVYVDKALFTGNNIPLSDNAEMAGFLMVHGKALIGLNGKNEPAKLLILDLQNGNQKPVSLTQSPFSSFIEMSRDSTGNKLYTSVRSSSAKTLAEYSLSVLDTSGVVSATYVITSGNPDYELLSMKYLVLDGDRIILAGTYGEPQGQKGSSKTILPPDATGFFFSSVKQGEAGPMIFYNFLEFKNIGSVIGEKDIQAIKRKSEKKNRDLKEYSVDLSLLVHPLHLSGSQVNIGADAFYPQYHTENFTDYDFYGRPFTNTYSVFDGYRYSRFIIAGLDLNGKLLWDNSIEIRNLISFELKPKVTEFDVDAGKVLAYFSEGKIASKIIRGNEVVEKLEFSPLEMNYPNDKLISESREQLIPWYDHYFLCSGYQEIKNVVLEKNNKRLVFFFNKIKFE